MRVLLFLILAAMAARGQPLSAQDMELPVSVQVPLFRKVLSFDRRLDVESRAELVIAVVYQGDNRESSEVRDQVVRAFTALPAGDTPLRLVSIDIDREQLARALAQHRPAAMYVTPLRAVSVRDIAATAAAAQVTTLTGVPRYIESGMAVSVRLLDQRPKLMLNVTAATAQGADFSSDLLRLAQVRR